MAKLVSPNQVSFVPGRQITDNIVVAQEVLHKFKTAQGKKGFIAWKIDLSKAYDRLHWQFVREVLWEVGIRGHILELLMHCISTVQYKPFSIVNDLILFGEASIHQAHLMKLCLDEFCHLSGQKVSFDKSRICVSPNICSDLANSIATISGSPHSSNLGKYLGVPLIHTRVDKSTYQEVIAKLPIFVCDRLDQLNRNFLWGHTADKATIHLVNWETSCKPKIAGGLGIKKMAWMNQALLAKSGWRLLQHEQGLWAELSWNRPNPGGCKINSDGSRNNTIGQIGVAGVLRDATGAWLKGYSVNLGIGSVLEAELWGIFWGLSLAWDSGFRTVEVESDSKVAVTLLHSLTIATHPLFNIINCCKVKMSDDWVCSVRHILREQNCADRVVTVDALATTSFDFSLGLRIFEEIPACIADILVANAMGDSRPRLLCF
ncbi:unnamed protein product [Prunus brigantina]